MGVVRLIVHMIVFLFCFRPTWLSRFNVSTSANCCCRSIYWIIYFPIRINANGIKRICALFWTLHFFFFPFPEEKCFFLTVQYSFLYEVSTGGSIRNPTCSHLGPLMTCWIKTISTPQRLHQNPCTVWGVLMQNEQHSVGRRTKKKKVFWVFFSHGILMFFFFPI